MDKSIRKAQFPKPCRMPASKSFDVKNIFSNRQISTWDRSVLVGADLHFLGISPVHSLLYATAVALIEQRMGWKNLELFPPI